VNELTKWLSVYQPIVMGGAAPTMEEFRKRSGEGYVLVKLTETREGASALGGRLVCTDADLAGAYLYVRPDANLVWQSLRAGAPVVWNEHPRESFWAVTRRADVRCVLGEYETFSSEHGTSEPFSSCLYLADLQNVNGLGELPGAAGAVADLAEDAQGIELGVCAPAGCR
jgi:hypothetical protein